MIKKKNTLLFLLFYLIEYNDMYKNRHKNNWGHKQYGFTQYNPILNGRIIEPVNSFSSLSMLIIINKYKDTIFDLLQFITVLDISISSFLYHASRTQYGLYLDYNAINMYLINLIAKDLYIMKIIQNEVFIKKYLPIFIIINRLLLSSIVRKRFKLFNPIHSIQTTIFDCLMVFKIIGEISKLSNKIGYNITIYLFFICCSGYKSFLDLKKINLIKKTRHGKKFKIEPISFRGTSNIIVIITKYAIKFIYFWFVLKKRNNKEQINKQYLVFLLPVLCSALIFHEDYIKCCRVKNQKTMKQRETSLLQFHSIWHILCALAFYFYDVKYLKVNVENVQSPSRISKSLEKYSTDDLGADVPHSAFFVAFLILTRRFFRGSTACKHN